MPTYVYKCEDCEHTFEAHQRFSDDPLTDCPSCDTGEVRRVINNVGVVFKGSGFYITDSRNGKNGHVGAQNGRSDKAPEAGADAKKEEKTDKAETGAGEKKKEKVSD
ncbi:MAG: FmdB family zinc ribbon protein [Candidatus Promineifilaceae bacterium]|nr:FmdB family zinc ribbon protein [Candidatus Promineifilaceae bacterium]